VFGGGRTPRKLEDSQSGDVRADRWFVRDELFFKTGADSMTVLLWWEDEQQLIEMEEEEHRASRRSDKEEY